MPTQADITNQQQRLARAVLLRQENLPGRALLRSPLLNPPLKAPQVPLLIAPRSPLQQILEQRLGLQLWRLLQSQGRMNCGSPQVPRYHLRYWTRPDPR